MARAEWTLTAEDELTEIGYWIAVQGGRPQVARKILEEIRTKAERYAAAPHTGHQHPDFPKGWFYFQHKRWVVLYVSREHGIDVLRVVDASRDFPR